MKSKGKNTFLNLDWELYPVPCSAAPFRGSAESPASIARDMRSRNNLGIFSLVSRKYFDFDKPGTEYLSSHVFHSYFGTRAHFLDNKQLAVVMLPPLGVSAELIKLPCL